VPPTYPMLPFGLQAVIYRAPTFKLAATEHTRTASYCVGDGADGIARVALWPFKEHGTPCQRELLGGRMARAMTLGDALLHQCPPCGTSRVDWFSGLRGVQTQSASVFGTRDSSRPVSVSLRSPFRSPPTYGSKTGKGPRHLEMASQDQCATQR